MSSDERLAQRAAEGDERAFAEIFERYHQQLYRFCLAMVGNPHDAHDTLQNAMVKVLRSLPGEEREIRLKPWLYRIARNESLETLRKRSDSAELDQHEPVAGGVAETAEARERLRMLLADLEQLPERQRAALVMRELSGLDFDQIGAAFGSSAAVARQTLYEARLGLGQLEAGREMLCAEVTRALSDADGRVTRRRDIRAHLRDCPDCRAFRDGIAKRRGDLAALAPLPLAASTGILHGLLGKTAGTGAGGGGVASGGGASVGKAVATSAIVKSAATVAAVAVIGASAAGRGGLIDLPVVSENGKPAMQSGTEPRSAHDGAESATLERATSTDTHTAGRSVAGDSSQLGGPSVRGDGESRGAKDQAASGDNPSGSQRGFSPPGGGYGRSASDRRGRPEQPPEAASHGQQTAQAHKPTHAASPPSHGGSGSSHAKSSPEGGAAAAKPPPAAKAPSGAHATTPSQTPDEVPAEANSGTADPRASATPPEHGR